MGNDRGAGPPRGAGAAEAVLDGGGDGARLPVEGEDVPPLGDAPHLTIRTEGELADRVIAGDRGDVVDQRLLVGIEDQQLGAAGAVRAGQATTDRRTGVDQTVRAPQHGHHAVALDEVTVDRTGAVRVDDGQCTTGDPVVGHGADRVPFAGLVGRGLHDPVLVVADQLVLLGRVGPEVPVLAGIAEVHDPAGIASQEQL